MGLNMNDISYIDTNGNRITVGTNTPLPVTGGGGGGGSTTTVSINDGNTSNIVGSSTTAPVGTERGLLVRTIPSGTPNPSNIMQVLGAALSASNPLLSALIVGGAQVATGNPLPVVQTGALPAGSNLLGTIQVRGSSGSIIETKSASTAAVATDTSGVVQLSPNTPFGKNALPFYDKGAYAQSSDDIATALNATSTNLAAIDCVDYQSVSIQIVVLTTFTGTLTYQVSNDGTNWSSKTLNAANNGGVSNSSIMSAQGVGNYAVFSGDIGARYIRVIQTAYTSGQVRVIATVSALSTSAIPAQSVTLNTGTNTFGAARLVDASATNYGAIKAASTAAVAADPSLVVGLSPNSPIPAGSSTIGNLGAAPNTESGTLAALNATVGGTADLATMGQVQLQVTGTWVGTITFQVSNDQTNWITKTLIDHGLGRASALSANGAAFGHIGARYFRVIMSAYTSGTATATIRYNATPGEMPIANTVRATAGSDGQTASNVDEVAIGAWNATGIDRIVNGTSSQTNGTKSVLVTNGFTPSASINAAASIVAGTTIDGYTARPAHTLQVDVTTTTIGTAGTHTVVLQGSLDNVYWTVLGTVSPPSTNTSATDTSNHANVSVSGFPYRYIRANWTAIPTSWVGTLTARVVSA